MSETLGIDISNWQKVKDWGAVARAGVEVVYVKATEGSTYKNPQYSKQMHGAENVGMRIGAYHFFRPKVDAEAQAQWFIKQAGWVDSWLPPVLDVEVRDDMINLNIVARISRWLDMVSTRVGKPAIIYTSPAFWNSLGNPTMWYEKDSLHPLWVAHYGVKKPRIPAPWAMPIAWQYTSDGQIPGIPGRVDLNVWYDL